MVRRMRRRPTFVITGLLLLGLGVLALFLRGGGGSPARPAPGGPAAAATEPPAARADPSGAPPFNAPDAAPQAPTPADAEPRTNTVRLTATVLSSFDDFPIAGVIVRSNHVGADAPTMTDDQGRWTVDMPRDAPLDVRLSHVSFEPGEFRVEAPVDADTHAVTWRLEPGRWSIRGRVVDTTGTPIAGAVFIAGDEVVGRSRADGWFVLTAEDGEGLTIDIEAPGFEPTDLYFGGLDNERDAPLVPRIEDPLGGDHRVGLLVEMAFAERTAPTRQRRRR